MKARPWVGKKGWRYKAIYHLKSIGLVETNSLDKIKNRWMWETLVNHYGGSKQASEALYPTKKENATTEKPSVSAKELKYNRLERQAFYDSDAWKRLRYQALKIHGATCQCCGASRADGVQIHVDHIKPRSKYPELELTLSNLQILCEPCNIGKSASDETDWRDQPKTRGTVVWN